MKLYAEGIISREVIFSFSTYKAFDCKAQENKNVIVAIALYDAINLRDILFISIETFFSLLEYHSVYFDWHLAISYLIKAMTYFLGSIKKN